MRKCFYFLSVIAMAMLAVSCDDIEGENPNEDVPEIIDPFLGDILPNDYTTNQANFEAFTDVLLQGCYKPWSIYQKVDGNWIFYDLDSNDGTTILLSDGAIRFFMVDSQTLIKWELCLEDVNNKNVFVEYFTKYSISYNPTDATITMTEILDDGTTGKTYFSTLLSGAPRFVTEGHFGGMEPIRTVVDDQPIYWEIRWCFKECNTERAELLEKYAKWLSEQEQE